MPFNVNKLNKVFDNRIRLGIMSLLLVESEVSFLDLKNALHITDGNLASHIKNLEEEKYIKVHKGFIGKKTNTTYTITSSGEKAFKEHIAILEKVIKSTK